MTGKEHSMQSINTVSNGKLYHQFAIYFTYGLDRLVRISKPSNQILKQDPQGTYSRMDLESRSYYRHKVEQLAKEYDVSEVYIAKEAVNLAKKRMMRVLKEK